MVIMNCVYSLCACRMQLHAKQPKTANYVAFVVVAVVGFVVIACRCSYFNGAKVHFSVHMTQNHFSAEAD